MNKDIFTLQWQDYEIQISYTASAYKSVERIYGYAMCHIEIETLKPERAALPVTESGYRSIFITAPELEEEGGVKTLVLGMLDEAAQKQEWKEAELQRRQYKLF